MNYKIGIFGSSAVEIEANSEKKAIELGRALSNHKVTLITGACSGLPYLTARYGSKNGNPVWGYSPKLDLQGQRKFTPKDDLSIYKKLVYIPKEFEFSEDEQVCKKYRNVISTANCDCGIIISGRWGTMNEFTNLYDMGKVIGVLTGTGGVADELEGLSKKIQKKSKAKIILDDSPPGLVGQIIKELNLRRI
ncbi:MAG: hypothetical protein HYT07_03000 [Candidatus Levybacteria bacterium]|nr:hypothetical protein [Candidatus Levybacteria bacterium]